MQGSNLSIQISADTSKARAEADLLTAKIRELRKEVRAASDEANRSGGLTPRLTDAREELDKAEAQLKSYNREARRTVTTNEAAETSFKGLSGEIAKFSRAMGVAGGHSRALRAGFVAFAGAEVIRGFIDITKKITELGEASEKIGVTTKTIQDLQKALGDTGHKAEDAAKMLEKLTEPFSEARKKELDDYWNAGREGLEKVKEPTSAYAGALKELGINMSAFGTDMKGQRDLALAVAKALDNLAKSGRVDDANRLSVQLLGKNWREAGEAMREFIRISEAGKSAAGTGPASPEAQESAKQFRIALSELGDAWDNFASKLVQTNIPKLLVNSLTGLVYIADGIVTAFGKVGEVVQAGWDKLNEFGTWLNDTYKSTVGEVAKAFSDAWTDTSKLVSDKIQILIDAYNSLIAKAKELLSYVGLGGGGAAPAPAASPQGMASGGYVSGPGTTTSDSVLARLSNGEFVMRAAAVNRWGPRFMAALNNLRNPFAGFAQGGLVTPRFAGGGLITTGGGGATVNLVFPGGSFALRADNETIGALTREARRAGMLAAGRPAGVFG